MINDFIPLFLHLKLQGKGVGLTATVCFEFQLENIGLWHAAWKVFELCTVDDPWTWRNRVYAEEWTN
jgi:hypothetical protein